MEIKNIKNRQQEAFIQNLEKGFMVSNGVYADNFINRKLGRVGQPYKKGEEKKEEESVVGKVKGKVKEWKEKTSKALLDKKLQTKLDNVIKDILEDNESGAGNIIRMENNIHDGLKEAKAKHGFEECYYTTIKIGNTERTYFAAKDKKGNISWFGAENELLANHTPIFDERNNFVKYVSGGMDLDGVKKSFEKSKKYDKETKEISKKAKKGKWNPAPGPLAKKQNPFQ